MPTLKDTLLKSKHKLLSIYFTAGFPKIQDTIPILKALSKAGVDFIEIGLPFSDPLADGPTIQHSSETALKNGMNTTLLFEQLTNIKTHVNVPLILMGYFNPILQFGVEPFCQKCKTVGIEGLIIPDLPLEEVEQHYLKLFKKYALAPIFLVTPETPIARIRKIDAVCNDGFIYAVSNSGTTGANAEFNNSQITYLKKLESLNLENPLIVGFGIHNKTSFAAATTNTKGAIVGSAFIKMLAHQGIKGVNDFVSQLR